MKLPVWNVKIPISINSLEEERGRSASLGSENVYYVGPCIGEVPSLLMRDSDRVSSETFIFLFHSASSAWVACALTTTAEPTEQHMFTHLKCTTQTSTQRFCRFLGKCMNGFVSSLGIKAKRPLVYRKMYNQTPLFVLKVITFPPQPLLRVI